MPKTSQPSRVLHEPSRRKEDEVSFDEAEIPTRLPNLFTDPLSVPKIQSDVSEKTFLDLVLISLQRPLLLQLSGLGIINSVPGALLANAAHTTNHILS